MVVNPKIDTVYYLAAESVRGCFGYDTIRIKVAYSTPINLGEDKAFCAGDSAVLNAGAGFAKYSWSNGSTTPATTVYTKGMYHITATAANGCSSKDTVVITDTWPLPKPALSKTSQICTGSTVVLNPGPFAQYRWQDGSSNNNFTATATGAYWVQVWDANNCTASDTAIIKSILPLPTSFLPPDTAICSYGNIVLQTTKKFNTYRWSTGSAFPEIKIEKAGTYWLQVQDHNGCTGRDTVVVKPKDCLTGIYVPTAFSPNNDGKNDSFRPLLFGRVKSYRFTVYNRWGEVVFQTTNLQQGWNGLVKNAVQSAAAYMWICTYEFEGENTKTERGTVTLIR